MSQLVERKDADPCDMQSIFDGITQLACDGLDVSRVSIWLYNDNNSAALCASAFDHTNGPFDILDELILEKYPAYKKALKSDTIIIEDNALLDPKTVELSGTNLLQQNTRSLYCTSIWVDGENIGYLCNEQTDTTRKWITTDQNFVRSITDHIAIAIGNCRRNKTEQSLKESELRYELAVSGSNDGLWDWDMSSNKVYRSTQYKRLLGYNDTEMSNKFDYWKTYLHPDDVRRAQVALDAHLEDEDVAYEDEFRLQTKTGEYRWFRCRGNALRNDNGQPYRVSGSIADINEFKYVQRNLNRFKRTLNEITENIFMFDPETLKFFYVNKSACDDIGYTEKELLNMTPVDIKPNFNKETFRILLNSITKSPEQSLNLETIHQRKNGEQITVDINIKYIAPVNSPPRFVSVVRDMSERRKIETESYMQRTMLEYIYKLQDNFISGSSRTDVFEQLINGILDISESDFGLIGEVIYPDNEPPYLRSRHISGISLNNKKQSQPDFPLQKNFEFKDLNNLLGEVITSSDTVINNDIPGDSRPTGFPDGCPILESYLGMPVKLGNRLIGIIAIANRTEGYDESLITRLQPLLSTCANLLNAERTEEARMTMEAALVEAKEEAEQANRTKSEFLSSMSHELRTPLNAIMGFAQLLQLDGGLSEIQKKHAKVIHSAGDLLLDLINDVLDLAKIEAEQINLSIEAISIDNILNESFEYIKPLAEKHNINLKIERNKKDCHHLWVRADNTRFKQVLLNLLSNAIKYNKENGTVSVSSEVTQQGMYRLCITDNGRGISDKNIVNLFQPFNRLGAQNGDIEGTGIGLVITRKLVELMGGTISVESKLGKGSTFIIDMPPAESIEIIKQQTEEIKNNHPAAMEGSYHILVAEDNQTNQQLIALQLETLGHTSEVVDNGKDALKKLQEKNFDLLLTDIHMPEMDGYELTQAIRKSRKKHISDIKIIAATANAASNEAKHCIKAGMNDYLPKPINITKLQNMLAHWLTDTGEVATEKVIVENISNIQPQLKQLAATNSIPSNEEAVDIETLERYIGGDTNKKKRFFKLFLDTSPKTIDDIQQAYLDHSLQDIEAGCHKLKSSAHAIGAIRLASICQNMETASISNDWESIDAVAPEIGVVMSAVENYIQEFLQKDITEKPACLKLNDVLVVDDDLFVLDLLTLQLNSIGINKIETASSGEAALTFINAAKRPPSVLLLDLNMPAMDGVEFLRHLSKQSYTGSIILISAEDSRLLCSAENIARDRNLNILGSLEKPLTIEPLSKLLQQVGEEPSKNTGHNKVSCTEKELRNAISNNEFTVYFQPQVDVISQQLSGVEALVRWRHPKRGMIPPDAFVPVAEELGLINDMTDIIMNEAMQQCASWRDQGLETRISINISVDSLDRLDLPEHIVGCAQKHQLDVANIILEITESRLMQDITSALDILTRLSLKGLGLSIDDFGTGYSSMEQLQRIPFEELKIDRSFVNGAAHNKPARAILQSSVDLAQKLNMTIVAEGVEDEEELALVAKLGCTTAQGFYIGRPMPGEEFVQWHKDWQSKISAPPTLLPVKRANG